MKKKDWEKRYEVGFNAILYRERKDSHEDKLNWVKAFSMDFIQQEIDRAREEFINSMKVTQEDVEMCAKCKEQVVYSQGVLSLYNFHRGVRES